MVKLLLDENWSPSIPEALTGALTGRDGQQQESGAERVHGGAQSLPQARARLFNPRRGVGRFAWCHTVLTPVGDSGLCSRGASLSCRRSEPWVWAPRLLSMGTRLRTGCQETSPQKCPVCGWSLGCDTPLPTDSVLCLDAPPGTLTLGVLS